MSAKIIDISPQAREARRERQAKEQTAERLRLDGAAERLSKRLKPDDRLQMAQNLGKLVTQVADKKQLKELQVIKTAFDAANVDNKSGASSLPKRKRWILLRNETTKDELGAKGHFFVALAQRLVQELDPSRSQEDHRKTALNLLLRDTLLDPDPLRIEAGMLDASGALDEVLQGLLRSVLNQVPKLPWYFKTLSDHQLAVSTMDCGADRNEMVFEAQSIGQYWVAGLLPEHVRDGLSLTEEWNSVSLQFPTVRLGTINISIRSNGVWLPQLDIYPSSGVIPEAEALALWDEGTPEPYDITLSMPVSLVIAPFGGTEEADLKLAIIFDDAVSEDEDHNLVVTGTRFGIRRHKGLPPVLIDVRPFESNQWAKEFFRRSLTIESVGSPAAKHILLALLSSEEYDRQVPLLSFSSLLDVPAAAAPVPARTLGGMLVRNSLSPEPAATIQALLATDASKLVQSLERTMKEADREYVRAKHAAFGPPTTKGES